MQQYIHMQRLGAKSQPVRARRGLPFFEVQRSADALAAKTPVCGLHLRHLIRIEDVIVLLHPAGWPRGRRASLLLRHHRGVGSEGVLILE